jgi:hypothetical protein
VELVLANNPDSITIDETKGWRSSCFWVEEKSATAATDQSIILK